MKIHFKASVFFFIVAIPMASMSAFAGSTTVRGEKKQTVGPQDQRALGVCTIFGPCDPPCCDGYVCNSSNRCEPCAGQLCDTDDNCCEDLVCDSYGMCGPPCTDLNGECDIDDNCCDDLVCYSCDDLVCDSNRTYGLCGPPCADLNGACDTDDDCCDDLVCDSSNMCGPPCADLNGACAIDDDCCDGLCGNDGICECPDQGPNEVDAECYGQCGCEDKTVNGEYLVCFIDQPFSPEQPMGKCELKDDLNCIEDATNLWSECNDKAAKANKDGKILHCRVKSDGNIEFKSIDPEPEKLEDAKVNDNFCPVEYGSMDEMGDGCAPIYCTSLDCMACHFSE